MTLQITIFIMNIKQHHILETTMKKLIGSALVALSMTGLVFACGGMTQIDPPSLQLDAGQADLDLKSVVEDIEGVVCLA